LDQETGKIVCGFNLDKVTKKTKAKTQTSVVAVVTPPVMTVSEVSNKGIFTLSFNEPMNLEMFAN